MGIWKGIKMEEIKGRIAKHLHSSLTTPKLALSLILQMQIYMSDVTHTNDYLQDQAQRSSLLTEKYKDLKA